MTECYRTLGFQQTVTKRNDQLGQLPLTGLAIHCYKWLNHGDTVDAGKAGADGYFPLPQPGLAAAFQYQILPAGIDLRQLKRSLRLRIGKLGITDIQFRQADIVEKIARCL